MVGPGTNFRRGAQIVQKAGAAVVQGISLRAQKRTEHELLKHERNMEKVRIAGKMRRYIKSPLKRNEFIGLSPHLTVSEVVREIDGEARVDAKGKAVLQMVVAHLKHKAERIEQWMSREGLEGERKWMTDTESAPGASLLSPFCQDTAHGRDLRERVIRGETAAAAGTVPTQFWPVLIAAKADDKVLNNTEFSKVDSRHTRVANLGVQYVVWLMGQHLENPGCHMQN
jgi:hypothetical protein